jgi:aurora kinase
MRKTFCGTYDYVSPEVSQGFLYDEQVDAWAVGVLTYEMITATVPFKQKLILKQEKVNFLPSMSRAVRDFISGLLIYNPKKRMTVREALQHNWLHDDSAGDESLPSSEIKLLINQME